MATEVIVTGKSHEGRWEAYQKDYSTMTLSGKIRYYEELGVLEKAFGIAKKRRWLMLYWSLLAFPILISTLFNSESMGTGKIIGILIHFLLGAAVYALGWVLTRKCIVEKKINVMQVLIALGVYSIISLFQPEYYGSEATEVFGILFIFGIVLGAIYMVMAGKGYTELRERATMEQQAVEENLRRQLYSGALNPMTLKTKVSLEPMEQAYLEEPAMLIDMQQKEQYKQLFGPSFGDRAKSYLGMVTNGQTFTTGMRKAWNSFVEDGTETKSKKNKWDQNFEAAQKALIGSVGSLIITTDRVLYVTSTTGFQIQFSDLTSYYAQDGEVNTLVLESKSGRRTLQTDAGQWIVLLLDRLRPRTY